jgi:hypothetical protein
MEQPLPVSLRGFSRRQFLRVGFFGALTLSLVSTTAILAGCSSPPAVRGFRLLRETDIKVLRALLPVVLAGALPTDKTAASAVEETLHTLDSFLFTTSPGVHQQMAQLFDLLSMPATRYTIVGLGQDWNAAAATDINAFLLRWSNSRVQMLRAAHLGLTQMITTSWYLQPRSWAAIAYVAPRVVV